MGGKLLLWQSYNKGDFRKSVSIPELIEKNADSLRTEYLSFIYELENTSIKGKRVIDHFRSSKDFNLWWMSLISEKGNYAKSPLIKDIIKIFEFKRWLKRRKVQKVVVYSSNKKLIESIKIFCQQEKLIYKKQKLKSFTH